MATYKPRTSAPSANDKNYLHTSVGGYNSCIQISNGSCLPNCVGYSWGRWRELLGKTPKLSRGNAENWWGYKDGYERGQTPKLGAVICWRKGKAGNQNDGAGHVAIVEQINADGSILCSESNYGGSRFNMRKLKAPYSLGSTYTFQGFIYLPMTFEEEPKVVVVKKSNEEIAKEVIAGKWGNGQDRINKLTAAGFNYNVIQKLVNQLLHPTPAKKSIDTLAREVIAGMWGNGAERKKRLTAAGHDYNAVQKRVNELLR